MTCRHSAGDPNCSSNQRSYTSTPTTPDASKYEIEDVHQAGQHLVLKVKYPNCSSCAYEGNKVLVFLNTNTADALKWKTIDPHFRDPKLKATGKQAPSPTARFPASPEGWIDAVAFANSKIKGIAK